MVVPLPPAFDAATYIAYNPDLCLAPEEAADHYARTGRAEGRIASPLALRENLIAMIGDGRSVLEIGPFFTPLLRGPNIAYLDILDADQLRARAVEVGGNPADCPAWIDYVGGLEQVRRRFDAIVSSHAIEHQPDLVRHFSEIERILAPDGLYCLIVPDKRYCFDHHIAESTIAGVLQAHRDARSVHTLASVIEHVALTTHNDPLRHWAGDHGSKRPPDIAQRVRNAVAAYDSAQDGYVDVHAWYFTPDSFRSIVETLGALGMTGLEIAEVYDSARDRNEFCAVLRLGPRARDRVAQRAPGFDLIVLQTADADRYAPMLAITAANVREYCRRHALGYESFVGIKRGFHPWQATFNRIPMLEELAARGFTGWALYLDADAYIQDLDFDIAAYLADKGDYAAILATSGVTGEPWDVNAGVALVNLGHPLGRDLIAKWAAGFAGHSDDALRAGEEWFGAGNDQDILHGILRNDADIAAAVLIEPMSFMNGPHARFIRQQLRTLSPTFAARLADIRAAVERIFAQDGRGMPAQPMAGEDRWLGRLAHRDGLQPELVAAPVPDGLPALGRQVCEGWTRFDAATELAAPADFAAALRRGDGEAVAAQIANLGGVPLGEGFFGGARQHARARDRRFAERLARWTYDKLVSLAEAVGALPLENPENGRWGINARIAPVDLFAGIQAAIGADLSPPPHVGGHLGIDVGSGIILHMRMLDGIYAAWRLRQLADMLGRADDVRIAQMGGGAGLTAFYARRLGLRRYQLFDGPALNAIQRYVLGRGTEISASADGGDIATSVRPANDFAAAGIESIDLLFDGDSLPAVGRIAALGHLATAARLGIGHILSINQEGEPPGQHIVSALIAESGGYRLVARHRHWLRAGYVEEHFVRNG